MGTIPPTRRSARCPRARARLAAIAAVAAPLLAQPASAQSVRPVLVVPASSIARAQDAGIRAHTNLRFFVPATGGSAATPFAAAPQFHHNVANESPGSLACVFGLTSNVKGCRSTQKLAAPTGGSRMIAIVDAYYYPTALRDITKFSVTFHLPPITPSNFQVVYADGKRPVQDHTGGWELEEALDIEMAHALAPGAKIVLVEARSPLFRDLLKAVDVAGQLVQAAGGGEVSMSWGGAEAPTEEMQEKHFNVPGVVYLAAAGDVPGAEFPAVLSNVVAVGGTGWMRGNQNADLLFQAAGNFGGGPSLFVPRPSYQDNIQSIVGTARGTPDISGYFCTADAANPAVGCAGGAWVYDTTPIPVFGVLGWSPVVGTSAATPLAAAIMNNAGHFNVSSAAELQEIYNAPAADKAFYDIVTLSCTLSSGQSVPAVKGWDYCTGWGSPSGLLDK